ncbi:GNAT family N-acetyltransferase [soil metagenome]
MSERINEWRQGEYIVSTDKSRLNFKLIHDFLKRSYWAEGVSGENVRLRIENSLVFGLYDGQKQAGFARVVSDYAAFAYLADVFVLEAYRGRGLSKWLIGVVLSYSGLKDLKWSLATKDAQELYRRYGFTELTHPEENMEKRPMEENNG